MSWPSVESKIQLRLNVLRHRQKLLKLLENIDDTTLKPRIKFDPTDFDKLLGKPIIKKEEPESDHDEIKEEPVIEPYDSEDDLISVGSNEEWINTPPIESEIDNRRRSKRLSSLPYSYDHPSITSTEDHMYASDPLEEESYQTENTPKRRRSPLPVGQRTRSRPREAFDRIKHNAKERACREQIAKMFIFLRDSCSKLNSSRRIPSKQCILSAAKLECDALKNSEKILIARKKELRAVHAVLTKKLREMHANGYV